MNALSNGIVSRAALSYESLMYAAEWLVWRQDDATLEPGVWNAHVDSFVVHARRLYDFLSEEHHQDDDLILADVLDEPPEISLPLTSEFRTRMNKRVLHLTTHDEPELIKWPVGLIAKELGDAMDSVITALALSNSDHHARFEQARAGRPGFRKLIMGPDSPGTP